MIQQRLEESQREAMKEQLRREAEMERKKRSMEKDKVKHFLLLAVVLVTYVNSLVFLSLNNFFVNQNK